MKLLIHGRERTGTDHLAPLIMRICDVLRPTQTMLTSELANIAKRSQVNVAEADSVRSGHFDLLISLGGDGTMLHSARLVGNSGTPILGINLGRLGFLTAASADQLDLALDHFKNGRCQVEQRSLVELIGAEDLFGSSNFALNELSVHKGASTTMTAIDAHLNGRFICTYWADGLIVSTPTGSTGYSLSVGGPIVAPNCDQWVITPIAPHNLSVRPLVISDQMELELRLRPNGTELQLALDSRSVTVPDNTILRLRKAPFTVGLVRMPDGDYFQTLRDKLMWGRDLRN